MSLNKFTIQTSFAINAGAGSGKTYTLSRRYINALLGFDYFREDYNIQKDYFESHEEKKAKVNQIVTITYTEAAALEMKGRIFELISKIVSFEKLDKEDGDFKSIQEANQHIDSDQKIYVIQTLQKAYQDSANSKISTIHSYCLDLIKVNADIAQIDVDLNIIKEDEKSIELSSIIFEVMNDEKNKEKVLNISKDIAIHFLNTIINQYVSNAKFRTNYDSFKKESISRDLYIEIIKELYPLPELEDVLEELKEDKARVEWFNNYHKNFINFDAKIWKEVDPFKKTPTLGVKKYPITDNVKKIMDSFVQYYSYIDEEKENLFFEKIEEIKELLKEIKSKYDLRLKELGKIDFDTIILKTLELVPHASSDFKYIMVDEFQDTNETQFEIVKQSRNEHTNLFVVGDSKQSIYSFQGAEIEVFNNAIDDLSLFPGGVAPMSKNHRSDGCVLDNVNNIFESLLHKDESLHLIAPNYEATFQELSVFKEKRKQKGSFKYLITKERDDENNNVEITTEAENIAYFVSCIANGKLEDYLHITKLIENGEKAIAIVYDSSTKMLELKKALLDRGIRAKVSATENFYHTKEINDIFNVLKAIDIVLKNKKEYSAKDKYYLAAAHRSNILRYDDNSIKNFLQKGDISEKLKSYAEYFNNSTLTQTVKFIYDDSNLLGVFAHFEDVEQRAANLNKFLMLCQEFELSNETKLFRFLALIENAIYFSNASEEEAFYISEKSNSIEICTIHATKGLAYPLVLLANSTKGLYSQIQSDSLKHNNFKANENKTNIIGFKINDYNPLSLRILKKIDQLKHMAEKKRLLYVALTRAEHDVVISAQLKQNQNETISLRADSYLDMIIESLKIDITKLYKEDKNYCIKLENYPLEISEDQISYTDHSFQELTFTSRKKRSATEQNSTYDTKAAKLGIITHKIFELYWDKFDSLDRTKLFKKFDISDIDEQTQISNSIEKFQQSPLYSLLKGGVEHRFELEFNFEDKTGFIDLVYFDTIKDGWVIVDFKTGKPSKEKELHYQTQLEFYENILSDIGYKVVGKEILWV